jgi:hypothetical protein
LLDTAIRELRAFDLDKGDNIYERLLNGVLYEMRLFNRLVPA